MPIYVVRVWVPDRPGALGAVASRIGAVRGDLVGIDILERGAGRAIDELVVELPEASLLDLMVGEITEVDGVDVEDVRQARAPTDPRLDALETAAYLVERQDPGELLEALVGHAVRDFEAEWAVVVDPSAPRPLASSDGTPPEAWISAFVRGAHASLYADGASAASPSDVAWADMAVACLVVALGRDGRPFRTRERRQLSALARIADNRWAELVAGPGARGSAEARAHSVLVHPAATRGAPTMGSQAARASSQSLRATSDGSLSLP
ncbi:MAG: hypothetical protein M0005_08485 [Actinomycetota bacterium]|jgi:hypothetical protein|nr:hypothetical protein [Actinomycetota bacterium]